MLLRVVTMALIKDQRILCSFLIIILGHYTEHFLVMVTVKDNKIVHFLSEFDLVLTKLVKEYSFVVSPKG